MEGYEDMAELATLDRMIKERDHLMDILELIQSGEVKKAERILARDIDSLNEAIRKNRIRLSEAGFHRFWRASRKSASKSACGGQTPAGFAKYGHEKP